MVPVGPLGPTGTSGAASHDRAGAPAIGRKHAKGEAMSVNVRALALAGVVAAARRELRLGTAVPAHDRRARGREPRLARGAHGAQERDARARVPEAVARDRAGRRQRAALDAPVPVAEDPGRFPELDELGIGYGMRDGNMVISIPSEITFASGKAELSEERQGRAQRRSRARCSRSTPRPSTGSRATPTPIRSRSRSSDSNRDLSVARAMAVLHYLVEDARHARRAVRRRRLGRVPARREQRHGRQQGPNRRVEIVVRTHVAGRPSRLGERRSGPPSSRGPDQGAAARRFRGGSEPARAIARRAGAAHTMARPFQAADPLSRSP